MLEPAASGLAFDSQAGGICSTVQAGGARHSTVAATSWPTIGIVPVEAKDQEPRSATYLDDGSTSPEAMLWDS